MKWRSINADTIEAENRNRVVRIRVFGDGTERFTVWYRDKSREDGRQYTLGEVCDSVDEAKELAVNSNAEEARQRDPRPWGEIARPAG